MPVVVRLATALVLWSSPPTTEPGGSAAQASYEANAAPPPPDPGPAPPNADPPPPAAPPRDAIDDAGQRAPAEHGGSPPSPSASDSDEAPADEDPAVPDAVVRGRVGREGSRDAVAAARVIIGDAVAEVDSEGKFELPVDSGKHRILVRAEGYIDRIVDVEVGSGELVTLDIRLSRDLDRPFRTIVDDRRDVAVSRTTLRGEEINAMPGSGGDPFRAVQSLPGVATIAGFLPYVVVRGAAPGNTAYYLDGVRVPLLFHVAAGPSVIHPYFIDAVDFYPAGAPVRLGRFASGVIEGRTRRARSDRVRGEVDVRLTDAGALLEIPVSRKRHGDCRRGAKGVCTKGAPRGSLAVAGRYSYTGLILGLIPQLNVRLQFWDFQARFDHDLGARSRYRAMAYGAFDLIGQRTSLVVEDEMATTTRPEPLLRFEFYRLDQRIYTQVRDGEFMTQVALGYDRSGAQGGGIDIFRVMPRLQLVRKLRPGVELGVGYDQEFQFFRAQGVFGAMSLEDAAMLLSDRNVFATGIWSDVRFARGRFELRPGLRADFYAQAGQSSALLGARTRTTAIGLDPRVVARESVSDRWTLRQSVGVYHQAPDSPVPIPGLESIGFDRGLQRNIQGSLGYEFVLPGDVAELTQDIYLGRLDNLLDYDLAAASSGDATLDDILLSSSGWAYGVETMLRLRPSLRVYGWVAYTLSRATRVYELGGRAPAAWDQTHILNVALGYRIGKKWRIGGRLHFHSGRPYTPLDPGQDAVEALATRRNRARLPSFFQFDARIERIWLLRRAEVDFVIDLLNATLSTEILACAGAETGGGEVSGVSSLPGCLQPQGIPYILPTIGVRVIF